MYKILEAGDANTGLCVWKTANGYKVSVSISSIMKCNFLLPDMCVLTDITAVLLRAMGYLQVNGMYLINSLIYSNLKCHNGSFAIRKFISSLLLIFRLCIFSKSRNPDERDPFISSDVILSYSLYWSEAGPLYLLVSDHSSYICLAVPYVPFIFTTRQGKTLIDVFPSFFNGRICLISHVHTLRSQILAMASCLCNFSFSGVHLLMVKIRESHRVCNEFEETLAGAVCEVILLERQQVFF